MNRLKYLLVAAIGSASIAQAQREPGTIVGKVKDAASAAPIVGALISLNAGDSIAVSDSNGQFKASVAPGTYTVNVKRIGFGAFSESMTIPDGSERTMEVFLTRLASLDTVTTTARMVEYRSSAL